MTISIGSVTWLASCSSGVPDARVDPLELPGDSIIARRNEPAIQVLLVPHFGELPHVARTDSNELRYCPTDDLPLPNEVVPFIDASFKNQTTDNVYCDRIAGIADEQRQPNRLSATEFPFVGLKTKGKQAGDADGGSHRYFLDRGPAPATSSQAGKNAPGGYRMTFDVKLTP